MTTARSDALNAVIETALTQRILTIPEVKESMESNASRRTVRRAFKDAEEYGWIQKQGNDASSWLSGDTARRYQNSETATPSSDFPLMYYVCTSKVPPAFLNGENVLASAGVAWRESGTGFSLGIPDANHLMIDSGGYQAASYFRDEYPYSPKQLHEWANAVRADVVWGMDWACEDARVLSQNTGVAKSKIRDWEWRLKKSWQDQVAQFEHYQQGRYDHEFRPVIQGHDPRHFKRFAEKLKNSSLPHKRVGIGTVCKRSDTGTIHDVVSTVRDIIPDADIHLFGATLNIWKDKRFDGLFESSDSAAWLQHDPESDSMYPDSEKRAYQAYKEKVENSIVKQKT